MTDPRGSQKPKRWTMILTYHEVVPEPSPYVYSTTASLLREHLQALSVLPSAPLITFDDGHRSHVRLGAPVLEEFGFCGIFFVTVGWIASRPGYMDWPDAIRLLQAGHSVQSHAWSHRYLTACSAQELTEELLRSRRVLEDRLGVEVTGISMPGGRYNARVLEACANCGYRRVYTSDPFQSPRERCGVIVQGRAMLRRNTTVHSLLRMLASEDQPLSTLRIKHAAKTVLRRAIGDRLYHGLWSLAGRRSEREAIDRHFSSEHAGT